MSVARILRGVPLLALGCVGLLLSSCASERNIDSERKRSPAGTQKSGAAVMSSVNQPKSLRTPVVIFFGTSLTAGAGLDQSQAFPALIEKLAAADGTPIKAVNAGLSGETSAGALRRIAWVLRTPADAIVIETGANDALRGLDPDSARSNIAQVIAAVRKAQPMAKIVLVGMEAPPNYGLAYTRRFRGVYSGVAKEARIPLVPFLLDGVAGVARLNQPDGVHPNAAGAKIVAANIWKSISPLVAELDRGGDEG